MKKLISLLLVIIITCSVLSGCDWDSLIDYITPSTTAPKWEAPEGVIETATVDENGNSITIAHSDNFTQDDIEFVAMWHNKKMGTNFGINTIESFSLGTMIRNAQDGFPLYLIHIENPYIIVAYLKPNMPEYELDERNNYQFNSEKYLWYKFNATDKIPNIIGDNKITAFSYVLYDCTITKDVTNNLESDYQCKYYLDYNEKSNNLENSEKFLAFYLGLDVCSIGKKFLSKPLNDTRNYKIYTNENGVEYLEILGDARISDENGDFYLVEDYVKMELWPYEEDYYDILSPYFIYFSHSDTGYEYEGQTALVRYVYIKIEYFIDAFFNIK